MRVLIIKTSSMGDVIHALPVLDYLHKACPGIEVDWVVEESFKDILEGNPHLHRLHIIRTRTWRNKIFSAGTLQEVRDVFESLRHSNYDLVFDIQGNLKSGIIAWTTGADQRLGFSTDFLQESVNALFTSRKIPMRKQDDHAGGRYLRVVSVPFGRDYHDMELSTDIYTPPEDDASAERLIRSCGNGPVFLFHSGTTWQTKFWSEEGWIQLGRRICADYVDARILLSWGNDSERGIAGRIAAGVGVQARLLEKCSIKGIAALIKKVDVVIGGDTGLIHLAAAVGTPTVSYYRASDGRASGPRGQEHVLVQSPLTCTRCFRTSCDKDSECRSSITVDAILSGIKRLQPPPKCHTEMNPDPEKVNA